MKNTSDLDLVSVVVPTYNSAAYLKRTCLAIVNQTYPCLEVVVVDDGSSDNTDEVLAELRGKYSNLRYIVIKHSGLPSVARNKGIEMSTGKWIALCDSDDIWMPNKLKNDMAVIAKQGDVGMVCSAARCVGLVGLVSPVNVFAPTLREGYLDHSLLLSRNVVRTSSVVICASLLKRLNGFDERKELRGVEDYELWVRVSKVARVYFRRSLSHYYVIRSKSVSADYGGMLKCATVLRALHTEMGPVCLKANRFKNAINNIMKMCILPFYGRDV